MGEKEVKFMKKESKLADSLKRGPEKKEKRRRCRGVRRHGR